MKWKFKNVALATNWNKICSSIKMTKTKTEIKNKANWR